MGSLTDDQQQRLIQLYERSLKHPPHKWRWVPIEDWQDICQDALTGCLYAEVTPLQCRPQCKRGARSDKRKKRNPIEHLWYAQRLQAYKAFKRDNGILLNAVSLDDFDGLLGRTLGTHENDPLVVLLLAGLEESLFKCGRTERKEIQLEIEQTRAELKTVFRGSEGCGDTSPHSSTSNCDEGTFCPPVRIRYGADRVPPEAKAPGGAAQGSERRQHRAYKPAGRRRSTQV